jgi:hypothetical protein
VDNDFVQKYGVSGFPPTFLIGPDGKIVAKKLRGENLVNLVKEKINNYSMSLN